MTSWFGGFFKSGSDTTTLPSRPPREATLVLRSKADQIRNTVEGGTNEILENAKKMQLHEVQDGLVAIDQAFGELQSQVTSQFEEMKQEVKSRSPRKPVRQPGETDEEFQEKEKRYQAELEDYKEYAKYVAIILQQLVAMFDDTIRQAREFFDELWEMMKKNDRNANKRTAEFMKTVRDDLIKKIDGIFVPEPGDKKFGARK
ncbi:hypothetical protein BaRGS_00003241 [Batillaria attramentaria]|uniref:BAR domain-containing protein n=1 Tax=Batillaria attramentaria TaxID=370345 RepID=A0ABD0M178_9CAEN